MIIKKKILNMVPGGKQMYTQRTASHTVCPKRRCKLYTGKTDIYSHVDHVFSNSTFNRTKVKK